MPALPNPRHERFAQELAKGKSAAEAYAAAGYEARGDSVKVNASRLLTDANVRARLAELQAATAEKAMVTLESLIAEAEEVRAKALADAKYADALNAIKEKGVLSGLRVEKSERKNLNLDASDLTDAELADIARRGGNGASEETRRSGKSDRVH